MASITVPYAEKYESMSGGADNQGQYETRVYTVLWEDRAEFMAQMAGEVRQSGGPGGQFVQTEPFRCPGNERLAAYNMAWEPTGSPVIPSDPGRFSHVNVTVLYRTPFSTSDIFLTLDPDEPLLANCKGEIDFGRESFSRIGGSKWLSDGKQINSAFGLGVTTIQITLTWSPFPFMPWAILREYADAVNDAPFLGAPRGHIMLAGPKVGFERNRTGSQALNLVVSLKYRSIPWNQSLRDDTSTWDTPVLKAYSGGDSSTFEKYKYKRFRKLLWEDYYEGNNPAA